jgi:xylulokinase
MWLDAIDLLMQRMKEGGVDFSSIVAISGAGQVCMYILSVLMPTHAILQQHGSVYWSTEGEKLLKSLDSNKSLASQLSSPAFTVPNAPIWQDSSTRKECEELEKVVGGAQALADLTGSRAYERFTGSQIMKVSCHCCEYSTMN